MIRRDELYFEPRVINEYGMLKWYGTMYKISDIRYCEKTVYVRDTGEKLHVYILIEDDEKKAGFDNNKIKATFERICILQKNSNRYIYGRRNK